MWKLKDLLSFALAIFAGVRAMAHEGHQPLPTRGVHLDSWRGYLVLSTQARGAIGLESEEVTVGDVGSEMVAYAETVAPWNAKAFGSAQISGRITKLLVRPGDIVNEGQVLAEMSSRELESVRLSYLQAKKELSLNRQLLESMKPAAQQGAVPVQRLTEIETAYQQSENDLEISRIRANLLGLDVSQFDADRSPNLVHRVRSPISGRIIHSDLAEGKYVEAFEHLFDIVNTDEVWIRIQILEKDIRRVAIGQSIEFLLSNSKSVIESKIDRIDASLDPEGQVCWAWASISRSSVIPGLVGTVKIRTSMESNRLSIPLQSVHSDGLQSYVFVEQSSTKQASEYRKRNVKLGQRFSLGKNEKKQRIEIVEGDVYPGDRVVVRGGHELSSLFFLGVLKLSDADRQRLGIRTATVSHQMISDTLNVPAVATLPPEARAIVSSQLPGTIHSHYLMPGQRIQRGDLLMEIASPEFQSLQLDLLRTNLDANLFQQRASRLEQVSSDVFSRRVVLETLNRAEQLKQREESIKRQLVFLGLSAREIESIVKDRKLQSVLPIRAAIDGFLVRWDGTLGETVIANQSLAEIQKIDDIWIEAYVPIQNMQMFTASNRGQAAVLSNPTTKFPVTISRLGPIVSPTTRTQRIWLTPDLLPRDFSLRDAMQLSVALTIGEKESVLAVPSEAVLRDGLHAFVFVQRGDGYIDRRRVTLGRSDSEWTEVLQGVHIGEEVIVSGGRELQTAFASLR
jgi:cobalt-zinc-cadmium efflux system membrane fusion protein